MGGFNESLDIKPKKCAGCKCYEKCYKHLMGIKDDIEKYDEYLDDMESRAAIYMYQDDLFSNAPYDLGRILEASVNVEDTPHAGVYFLIQNQEIVYVGQSKNCLSRIQSHINDDNKIFDSYTMIWTLLENLDFVESWYIHQFKPKYNKRAPINWPTMVEIGRKHMEKVRENARKSSAMVFQPHQGVSDLPKAVLSRQRAEAISVRRDRGHALRHGVS